MTALIGVHQVSGQVYLAADSRISWGARPGYPRRDNLQKLYSPAPNVVIAICGDLKPARAVLRLLTRWYSQGGQREFAGFSFVQTARIVVSSLFSAWSDHRLMGKVDFLIGVAAHDQVELYKWSSNSARPSGPRATWRLCPIPRGSAVVLGSIRDDSNLTEEIEAAADSIANTIGIDESTTVALLSHRLVDALRNGRGESVRVGGLFQIASSDAGTFYCHGYSAGSLGLSHDYGVDLVYGEQGRWEQVDSSGDRVRLRTLLEASLEKPRGNWFQFRY